MFKLNLIAFLFFVGAMTLILSGMLGIVPQNVMRLGSVLALVALVLRTISIVKAKPPKRDSDQ